MSPSLIASPGNNNSTSNSNLNNNNLSSSSLLRSPRRIKRESASSTDLMEDLRQQLSMPLAAPSLSDGDSNRPVVMAIFDDDDDNDDNCNESDDDSDDESKMSTLLQNTRANSSVRFSSSQQRQQQSKDKSSKGSNWRSEASVVSTQSTKSTRSLFSRLSRKSNRHNNEDDYDDGATVSSTKSWWKRRKERKQQQQQQQQQYGRNISQSQSQTTTQPKKKKTIFQSFRLRKKRSKGRSVHDQLVADFFDVQSHASEPDFVGSAKVQQARFLSADVPALPHHQVRLETRSVTSGRSQNSRAGGKFASFLFRMRHRQQQDGDPDFYGDNASLYSSNNLVGNHIETAQRDEDYDYDEEITLGSGFDNLSLADSLDDSSVCSENTFHSNLEAVHQRAPAEQYEQEEPLEDRLDDEKPQSFLQRMLSKSNGTSPARNHEIIRKAIGVAAPCSNRDNSKNNLSLNSSVSDTDSDENPAENNNDSGDNAEETDQNVIVESSTDKSNNNSELAIGSQTVGRGKSLMQGSLMANTRSVRSLDLPCVSDILEQPQTSTMTTIRRASRTERDGLLRPLMAPLEKDQANNKDDATKTTANSTADASSDKNRWDSDASVGSDTPLPKRPRRRTTDSDFSRDDDDTDGDEADVEAEPEEKEETKQQHEYRVNPQFHLSSPQSQQHKPLASQSMRNLKASEEEVDDESILSLLAGLLATWATEREAAAEEEASVVDDFGRDNDNQTSDDEVDQNGLGDIDAKFKAKGILKNSTTRLSSSRGQMNAETKDDKEEEEEEEEEEKVDDQHLYVTFDNVEIREYERIVGDNPSCTRGPPVAIGWAYRIANLCPLDDYETMIRGPRRSKREFHLTAEQRTQLLVSEWECSEEDIRRARREATYIQYCRAKTSFSGTRVAAKEAAFLRKANEQSKRQLQQQQQPRQQATVMMTGSMPMLANPPAPASAQTSPNRAKRQFQRPAQLPSAKGNRGSRPNNSNSNNGRSPQPVHPSPKPGRKAPLPPSTPSRPRRTGNNGSTSGINSYACPKSAPLSPSKRPKASPGLASSSSSTAVVAPELPPTRALLEV